MLVAYHRGRPATSPMLSCGSFSDLSENPAVLLKLFLAGHGRLAKPIAPGVTIRAFLNPAKVEEQP